MTDNDNKQQRRKRTNTSTTDKSRRFSSHKRGNRTTEGGKQTQRPRRPKSDTSEGGRSGWDSLAAWYDGWVGKEGSEHHQKLAIPVLMDLLAPKSGEHVLDVGCGQGVLAPYVAEKDAQYTGVDVSKRLLGIARKHHGNQGQFFKGDACKLRKVRELEESSFDAVTYLLSIQDIDPLDQAIQSAAWALKTGGRVVMLMTHPCFRIPRQSGWGFDENRKLRYRRIDRYLTPLNIPMKPYTGKQSGVSISFHRPLSAYVSTFAQNGFMIDAIEEIPTYKDEDLSDKEIPLFMGIRAWKLE